MSDPISIRGAQARDVSRPADEAQLAEVLTRAAAEGAACYVAGGLSKREWGAAPGRIDLLISTAGLAGCSDVDPDNLTLSAAPGTTVAEARAQAEAVGRVLPLDPSLPEQATMGGVAATGDQGARGAGYGGLRDLVLGVRATLADGSAVKFGGRTMKNVTGYDMTKLFVGSYGVLGVLTEITIRLLPRPDSQALVLLPFGSPAEAQAGVARILGSYLQPLALEVVSADALPADFAATTAKLPAPRGVKQAPATGGAPLAAGRPLLLAGFSGHKAAVDRSVREVTQTNPAAVAQVLRDDAAERLYEHLAADGTGRTPARLALRASVPISRALDLVTASQEYGAANGLSVGYRAGVARGRVDLLLELTGGATDGAADAAPGGPAMRMAACLSHMRAQAASMGGSLIVTGGAGLLPAGYDAWGDVGPALAIMRRIKERFDPRGILNPGRFVGGI